MSDENTAAAPTKAQVKAGATQLYALGVTVPKGVSYADAVQEVARALAAQPPRPEGCPCCGRPEDWSGRTAPGAPCMECQRYFAQPPQDDPQPDERDDRAEAAEHEVERLERQVAVVKAILDDWDHAFADMSDDLGQVIGGEVVRSIRAALAEPTPGSES